MDATTTSEPAPGAPAPPDPDRERYRRRQRRRAIIGWSAGVALVALVALAVVLGGEVKHQSPSPHLDIFSWEMTSTQYEAIHRGQGESLVLNTLGTTGLQEGEVEEPELLQLFPPPPSKSACSFWKLSDAPDHLVRLCFSDPQGVLLQKSVRAPDESGVRATLA